MQSLDPKSPRVTVIVPSYNHRPFVVSAINSILSQSGVTSELIVIDDGSTDGSDALIAEMAEMYGFQYRLRENKGLCYTLNEAIAMARGEYISILASDDIMAQDALLHLSSYLDNHPDVAAVGGNVVAMDITGATAAPVAIANTQYDFETIFRKRHGPNAPAAMIRRDAIREAGQYNPDYAFEDLYMWLKLANAGWKIAGIGAVVAFYRQHPGSMHKDLKKMTHGLLQIYADYAEHPLYRETVDRICFQALRKARKSKDTKFMLHLIKTKRFFYKPLSTFACLIRATLSIS